MFQIKRLAKNRQGTAALEFALIAPLFFAALFGTFEIGRALYERNKIASAAAIATREIGMNTAVSDEALKTRIKERLDQYDAEDLTITLTNQTIAGQTFKKIEISYDHDLLIKFGKSLSGFTLTATRYAPVVA